MIPWLDFKLFGNGWGIGAPSCDGPFYLLSGRFYHWSGGHVAQLNSFEWLTPKPGTERTIAGKQFRVFSVSRRGPRVMAAWSMVGLPRDLDEANATIRKLRTIIGQLRTPDEYAYLWKEGGGDER